ncbi:MAG: type 2 isopentenyl-diphosphate Delta-isomerase [Pseudomonadota bacterium]
MPDPIDSAHRDPGAKIAHLEACLSEASQYNKSAGFDRLELVHQALPGLSLDAIELGLPFLGKELAAPLMVAPMTGGVERGHEVNRRLARAAQQYGLAMGVGSVRVALEDPERAALFKIRDVAPDVLLFSNVGAGNLSRGWGAERCLEAMQVVDADHLLIHLNPMQEAVQGGDVDFSHTLEHIQRVAEALSHKGITVGVREVGFGLSAATARKLIDAGVSLLDCGGSGGTSWAKVEGLCTSDARVRRLAEVFGEWGIATADSLRAVRALSQNVHVIATGGLRSGLDLAKAIALGADLGAMARPFLLAAHAGDEALDAFIEATLEELRIAMFGVGAGNVDALKGSAHIVERR